MGKFHYAVEDFTNIQLKDSVYTHLLYYFNIIIIISTSYEDHTNTFDPLTNSNIIT